MYETKKKSLIEDFFIKNKEKSISGPKLVELFADSIDKSTIYRRLQVLENNKIIRKTYNIDQNMYMYQYADKCNDHLHLTCKKCGKTIHLECEIANEFMHHMLKNHGFNIDQYNSVIYGICKECE